MSQDKRQPCLFIVCGETGVGKTYRNIQEIKSYLKDAPQIGKEGRKVLIFDANDDDYPMVPNLQLIHLKRHKGKNARRIRPYNADGTKMSVPQMRDTVYTLIHNFKNGLLVLDDLDKYMTRAQSQDVVGLLTTNRHEGLDIKVGHQSISKITTTEWENCTWLRLHHQVDDVYRYRNRIPNYFLVRIASFIVNEQYQLTSRQYYDGKLSKEKYDQHKSFFVYVDMRRLKIRGCSKAAYLRATKKYLETEQAKKLRLMLQERTSKNKPKYKSQKEALIALLGEYLWYWIK